MGRRLLMISTDQLIFKEGSDVRARQIEYAKDFEEVHIIVFSDKHHGEQTLASNCWAYPTMSAFKLMRPFGAIRLGRFIIEKRGINEMTCQDPFLTAMAAVSLKKRFHLPLEIQVHTDIGSPNFTYSLGNKVRKFLALNYLPKADTIRVVSNRVRDYLAKTLHIEDSKIAVLPIKVAAWIKNAPIKINLRKKYPQFEKIVLMASRLEKEKNIGLALDAWKKIIEKIAKAGLIIVGNGSELEKLKSHAARLGIDSSVIFEGWADREALLSYYRTADLFLNTSLYEGYGLTLVEAHTAGLPVISTDVGIAREVGATIVEYIPTDISDKVTKILKS